MEVSVRLVRGKLEVSCPYNSLFIERAGSRSPLAGSFDREAKTWLFARSQERVVRALLLELFATDGDTHAPVVDLLVRVGAEGVEASVSDVRVRGRTLVRRGNPVWKVQLGEGVTLFAGADFPARGGSRDVPVVADDGGVRFLRVAGFPAGLAAGLVAEAPTIFHVLVEEDASRKALIEERERLLVRLAELDALLSPRASESGEHAVG